MSVRSAGSSTVSAYATRSAPQATGVRMRMSPGEGPASLEMREVEDDDAPAEVHMMEVGGQRKTLCLELQGRSGGTRKLKFTKEQWQKLEQDYRKLMDEVGADDTKEITFEPDSQRLVVRDLRTREESTYSVDNSWPGAKGFVDSLVAFKGKELSPERYHQYERNEKGNVKGPKALIPQDQMTDRLRKIRAEQGSWDHFTRAQPRNTQVQRGAAFHKALKDSIDEELQSVNARIQRLPRTPEGGRQTAFLQSHVENLRRLQAEIASLDTFAAGWALSHPVDTVNKSGDQILAAARQRQTELQNLIAGHEVKSDSWFSRPNNALQPVEGQYARDIVAMNVGGPQSQGESRVLYEAFVGEGNSRRDPLEESLLMRFAKGRTTADDVRTGRFSIPSTGVAEVDQALRLRVAAKLAPLDRAQPPTGGSGGGGTGISTSGGSGGAGVNTSGGLDSAAAATSIRLPGSGGAGSDDDTRSIASVDSDATLPTSDPIDPPPRPLEAVAAPAEDAQVSADPRTQAIRYAEGSEETARNLRRQEAALPENHRNRPWVGHMAQQHEARARRLRDIAESSEDPSAIRQMITDADRDWNRLVENERAPRSADAAAAVDPTVSVLSNASAATAAAAAASAGAPLVNLDGRGGIVLPNAAVSAQAEDISQARSALSAQINTQIERCRTAVQRLPYGSPRRGALAANLMTYEALERRIRTSDLSSLTTEQAQQWLATQRRDWAAELSRVAGSPLNDPMVRDYTEEARYTAERMDQAARNLRSNPATANYAQTYEERAQRLRDIASSAIGQQEKGLLLENEEREWREQLLAIRVASLRGSAAAAPASADDDTRSIASVSSVSSAGSVDTVFDEASELPGGARALPPPLPVQPNPLRRVANGLASGVGMIANGVASRAGSLLTRFRN
jgi:hypothetical protein